MNCEPYGLAVADGKVERGCPFWFAEEVRLLEERHEHGRRSPHASARLIRAGRDDDARYMEAVRR